MELSVLYFTPFLSPTHAAFQTSDTSLLQVIISKDFTVTQARDQLQCLLKLRVIMPERTQDIKLKKTFQDFLNLESALLKEIENNPTSYPFAYPFQIPQESNKMSFTGIYFFIRLLKTLRNHQEQRYDPQSFDFIDLHDYAYFKN